MFHAKDNWYFEKFPDNSVRIAKRIGRPESPTTFEIILTAEEWASVIATMSYYGEEDYGFYRALNFHRGDPIGETTPLIDKLGDRK
jgi:hypothetical protein